MRFLLVFILGALFGVLATPVWRMGVASWYADEFGRMTYRCDSAMREHMIAKQQVVRAPSDATVTTLKQAELSLIDCQDYDLLRKKLAMLGLTENEISFLSLRAIEEREISLQRVVETHEIRY